MYVFLEDELKRIHQLRASSYGQVPFTYQDSSNISTITPPTTTETMSDSNKDEEIDDEFVPHPNFSIPPGIEIVRS